MHYIMNENVGCLLHKPTWIVSLLKKIF